LAVLCALATSAHGNIITVANTNDSGPGSLRQALADANDGDTIAFDPALKGQTVTLTSGELLINKNITISGPGANLLAVSRAAKAAFRIFHVTPDHTVTIEGLMISNGSVLNGFGGGILNDQSALTMDSCALTGNSALGQQGFGGGIFSNGSGAGGAASLTITNSALSENAATNGGAIENDGASGMANLTLSNSTLSGNSANGIFSDGTANIIIANSTLSENDAVGISILSGMLDIGNTILRAAASGVNLNIGKPATVTSHGYNVSSDDGGGFLTGPGDQTNTDPLLGPLQDNGGPTSTHALLPGSPAIDAGNPNFTPPPFYDQRGANFWRVRDGRIDVGSFEVQAGTTPTPSPTPTATATPSCTPIWVVVDSPNANSETNTLYVVTGSNNNDVWAVGHYDLFGTASFRTLTMHWDGSAWLLIPSPNAGTDHDYLYGGTGSGNDVWAVGMYNNTGGQPGRTLTLHWNGSAWSQMITPNPGASTNLLNAMTGSGNDVWAGGEYSDGQFLIQRTLTLHWDGNAWTQVPSPDASTNKNFIYAMAGSGDNVWAVGIYIDAGVNFHTLTLHWDGNAWSIVPSPDVSTDFNYLNGVTGSGDDFWAVGTYDSGSGIQMLILHWDGSAWSVVPSPTSDAGWLRSATGTGSDVWAVGYFNDISSPRRTAILHWDGSMWSVVPSPNVGEGSNELYGVTRSGSDLWAVGNVGNQTLTLRATAPCTPTPTPVRSPTATATATATSTATASPTPSEPPFTPTPTPTFSATVTPTATETPIATPTLTPRPSPTPRVAPTPRPRPTSPPRP